MDYLKICNLRIIIFQKVIKLLIYKWIIYKLNHKEYASQLVNHLKLSLCSLLKV